MANTACRRSKLILTAIVIVTGLGVGLGLMLVAVQYVLHNARRAAISRNSHVASPETGYRFPAVSEIARMTVAYYDQESQKEVSEFAVPQQCWDEVLVSLSPSQYDPRPCKWQVLGVMEMGLKNGNTCRVDLYDLGVDPSYPDLEEIGAFSAGPDFESRKYYRGGYTTSLKAALKRAYVEHQRK